MTFNLIAAAWLPVRRASGARATIRPADVTDGFDDDPILALDFARADWNAALTEWLIGLYFLTMAPADETAWAAHFVEPPAPETLVAALAPLTPWFELDGDGPCAFQDHDTLEDNKKPKPLSALLIDAPGEQTTENNADLFIKRGGAETLSLADAAAALVTLQTYAPAGGAGHRTSMRGGGPLTTLVAPLRKGRRGTTLWDRVWANVPDADPEAPDNPRDALPWLGPTLTSEKGAHPVTPEARHPALAFFACPRRIRLVFGEDGGARVATGFRTRNYGANYTYWRHPLSPYYSNKATGEVLPLHPHAGLSTYRDWTAWWGLGKGRAPAESSRLWPDRRDAAEDHVDRTLIEAFGFDMDNMKARQWLEARLPWVPGVEADAHDRALRATVLALTNAADEAARALRRYAKLALYGVRDGSGYRLDDVPVDALPEPFDRFWLETQQDFEALLERAIKQAADGAPDTELRRKWLKTLCRHALRIFDDTVDLDGLTDAEPRRLLYARDRLHFALADHPKAPVLKALGITASPRATKAEPEETI